jgi:hypothetical protein
MYLRTRSIISKGYTRRFKRYAEIFKGCTDVVQRMHWKFSKDLRKLFVFLNSSAQMLGQGYNLGIFFQNYRFQVRYHSMLYHRSFSKSPCIIERWFAEADQFQIAADRSWTFASVVKIPIAERPQYGSKLLPSPLPNLWVECDWWVCWTIWTALGCKILHNRFTCSRTICLCEGLVHKKIYFELRNDESLFVFAWKYCQDSKTYFRFLQTRLSSSWWSSCHWEESVLCYGSLPPVAPPSRNKCSPFYSLHTSNVSYITWW